MKITVAILDDIGTGEQYVMAVNGVITAEDRLRLAFNFDAVILPEDEYEDEDGRYFYFREVELAKSIDEVKEMFNKDDEVCQ